MKFIKSKVTKIVTILIAIALFAISVVVGIKYKSDNDYSGTYSMKGPSGSGMVADIKKTKGGYDIDLTLTDIDLQVHEDKFYISDSNMGDFVTSDSGNELSAEIYEDMAVICLGKFDELQEPGSADYYLGVYNTMMREGYKPVNNSIVYILQIAAMVFFGLFILEIILSCRKFVALIAAIVMIVAGAAGAILTFKNANFEGRYYISCLGGKKSDNDFFTYRIYVNRLNDDYRVYVKPGNMAITSDENDMLLWSAEQKGNKLVLTVDVSDFINDMYYLGEKIELKQTLSGVKCYKTNNGETKEMKVKTESSKENFALKLSVELISAIYAVLFVILFFTRKTEKMIS